MSLKKRLRDNHNEVDAGPLNDVLFILLMFFLLVSTLANPNVVKVSNPKGKSDTKVSQNIVVTVTKDQKVFIGTQQIDILRRRQNVVIVQPDLAGSALVGVKIVHAVQDAQ